MSLLDDTVKTQHEARNLMMKPYLETTEHQKHTGIWDYYVCSAIRNLTASRDTDKQDMYDQQACLCAVSNVKPAMCLGFLAQG